MSEASRHELRQGLEPCLGRLWRYALVLSGANDTAESLVQATCRRAVERADQFPAGARLDRWLFSTLRSIWLDEIRPRRIREAKAFVDAEGAVSSDGAFEFGANILATQVLKSIARLPEAQRETALLVYGEGYSYAEAASALSIPIDAVTSRLAAARSALAKLK
ncbi:MAG TPA: RNA polymerase sigma factor [Roseiarcus sp.]|nr:RNA polymerase sigma factor [Roseiarcus sp.]